LPHWNEIFEFREKLNRTNKLLKNMTPKALVHAHDDFVGVATDDISKHEEIIAVDMDDTTKQRTIRSIDDIQLGHKIALKAITMNENIIEYGDVIGVATHDIKLGEHVHTHNLKSLRWK
jgi:(2R)-sulfolactate sulfo-lyase subunit alpha